MLSFITFTTLIAAKLSDLIYLQLIQCFSHCTPLSSLRADAKKRLHKFPNWMSVGCVCVIKRKHISYSLMHTMLQHLVNI